MLARHQLQVVQGRSLLPYSRSLLTTCLPDTNCKLCKAQILKRQRYRVVFYSKYTRALTFKNSERTPPRLLPSARSALKTKDKKAFFFTKNPKPPAFMSTSWPVCSKYHRHAHGSAQGHSTFARGGVNLCLYVYKYTY